MLRTISELGDFTTEITLKGYKDNLEARKLFEANASRETLDLVENTDVPVVVVDIPAPMKWVCLAFIDKMEGGQDIIFINANALIQAVGGNISMRNMIRMIDKIIPKEG